MGNTSARAHTHLVQGQAPAQDGHAARCGRRQLLHGAGCALREVVQDQVELHVDLGRMDVCVTVCVCAADKCVCVCAHARVCVCDNGDPLLGRSGPGGTPRSPEQAQGVGVNTHTHTNLLKGTGEGCEFDGSSLTECTEHTHVRAHAHTHTHTRTCSNTLSGQTAAKQHAVMRSAGDLVFMQYCSMYTTLSPST